MASAVEADITCPVCLEIFNQPVILRCLHTLCASCSSLVEVQPMKIQCPTCREFTTRSDITHDFKTQNWVELYKQLKQNGGHSPTAPPADGEAGSHTGNTGSESHLPNIATSEEAEALGYGTVPAPPPAGFNVPATQSLYPSLPPSYSEAVGPIEDVDEVSLKNFLNVDIHPEEVFKFRDKALSLSLIQGKIWVVMGDGSVKIFKKTGYQFGKYISSDVEVYQQASALWSVFQWQEGADKYVCRVKAVTEAHNGDVIAACSECKNSWSFDGIGLMHINNIGQVLATISSKHYYDVDHDEKLVYAIPVGKQKNKKVDIFHHNGTKWLLQRTIVVEPGLLRIGVGHNILFTCSTSASRSATTLCKYDLMAKPEAQGKYTKYSHDVIQNADSSNLLLYSVDPHGNCLFADITNSRLLLVDRAERWTPLSIVGRGAFKPYDAVMENRQSLVILAESDGGVTRLLQLNKT